MAFVCDCVLFFVLSVMRHFRLIFLDRQHLKEEICIKANDMRGLDMSMLHKQAHEYKNNKNKKKTVL